ncbi:hypothetical protein [Nostoc punctiforme]|uniref:hypothetical protein n=1 Tax=Nostoc punctiforme TaxID=272131 RepID=UPI0030ED97D8
MDMKIYTSSRLQMEAKANLIKISNDAARFLTTSIGIQKQSKLFQKIQEKWCR